MIYEVIVSYPNKERVYESLQYEGVLESIIHELMSDDPSNINIKRRCCGSVSDFVINSDTIKELKEYANVDDPVTDKDTVRKRLDTAIDNWYIRGKISPSDECVRK